MKYIMSGQGLSAYVIKNIFSYVYLFIISMAIGTMVHNHIYIQFFFRFFSSISMLLIYEIETKHAFMAFSLTIQIEDFIHFLLQDTFSEFNKFGKI